MEDTAYFIRLAWESDSPGKFHARLTQGSEIEIDPEALRLRGTRLTHPPVQLRPLTRAIAQGHGATATGDGGKDAVPGFMPLFLFAGPAQPLMPWVKVHKMVVAPVTNTGPSPGRRPWCSSAATDSAAVYISAGWNHISLPYRIGDCVAPRKVDMAVHEGYMVGKRVGYGKEAMSPHNLTMTMIGASLLWFGWFGFNAGSAL